MFITQYKKNRKKKTIKIQYVAPCNKAETYLHITQSYCSRWRRRPKIRPIVLLDNLVSLLLYKISVTFHNMNHKDLSLYNACMIECELNNTKVPF